MSTSFANETILSQKALDAAMGRGRYMRSMAYRNFVLGIWRFGRDAIRAVKAGSEPKTVHGAPVVR
jgi:hypothetical protein